MTTGHETVMMWIIAPVISAAAGALGGWLFGKRRQKIDDIDAATGTFNKIITQLRTEVQVLIKERELNWEIIDKQSQRLDDLASEVRKLSYEVENLHREKKENTNLKKKIEKYEKILTLHNIEF